jgi:predicted nuclease of predicted toxin-antitoxin system
MRQHEILADEGVDRQIVERLRDAGYRVLFIAELEPGIDDVTVLRRAEEAGALLLTADKDFGELIFRQNRLRGGVALLRLSGLSLQKKAEVVAGCLADHGDEMADAFTVISPGLLRIRRRAPLT